MNHGKKGEGHYTSSGYLTSTGRLYASKPGPKPSSNNNNISSSNKNFNSPDNGKYLENGYLTKTGRIYKSKPGPKPSLNENDKNNSNTFNSGYLTTTGRFYKSKPGPKSKNDNSRSLTNILDNLSLIDNDNYNHNKDYYFEEKNEPFQIEPQNEQINNFYNQNLNISDDNKKYLLNKGDLVVARTGASFGKTLYFNDDYPGIYASFLIKIDLNNNVILNRYYWHYSKSSLYWNQANNLVSRAGKPQFNSNAIKKIEINLPSLEEQQKIVSILDKFELLINDISEGLPAEIEARRKQYEYYSDKLLSFEEMVVNE